MAKGYRSQAVDFDALFDPDVVGDGPVATGYASAGVPLRYAALKYGTKRADVGFRVNGVDVSNLWAAKGTASYAVPLPSGSYNAIHQALTSSGNVQAALRVDIKSDGTFAVVRTIGTNTPSTLASGTWNTTGEPASAFEVMFTTTHAGGTNSATVSNGAAAYASLSASRGVQSTLGPYPSSDAAQRSSDDNVRILIRRVSTGQVVGDSTVSLHTETVGFA